MGSYTRPPAATVPSLSGDRGPQRAKGRKSSRTACHVPTASGRTVCGAGTRATAEVVDDAAGRRHRGLVLFPEDEDTSSLDVSWSYPGFGAFRRWPAQAEGFTWTTSSDTAQSLTGELALRPRTAHSAVSSAA